MDKQKRIEEIYQAALKEFSDYGFNRANISSIAQRLGMTKGNLYFFIKSKKQLYLDAVAWGLKKWQNRVFAEIVSESDPVNKFRVLCEKSYRYLAEDSVMREILIKDKNLFPIDPMNSSLFSEIHGKSIQMIAEIIEEGKSQGVFRKDFNTDHISHLSYSIYVMFIVKTYILPNKHSFEDYYSEAIDLILKGVLV